MHLHMFEYLSILKRDLDTHTDMYLLSWDGAAHGGTLQV